MKLIIFFIFPITGALSSGGIVGIIIAFLVLLALAGLVIFFVVTRNSPKKPALDIGSVGFDNALYSATKGTVKVSDKNEKDNIAVIADPTMMYDPSSA